MQPWTLLEPVCNLARVNSWGDTCQITQRHVSNNELTRVLILSKLRKTFYA